MIKHITQIISTQYRIILSHRSVVLIFIIAPLIYAFLYSVAYDKQVVTKVPIALIDNSQSTESNDLKIMLNASPYIDVAYMVTDMTEAKKLLYSRKIYGIVLIPNNYANNIITGEQSTIALYLDASYFLMYRQLFQGVASVISTINAQHAPLEVVRFSSHTLFNATLGYGSFIMPAILLIILQQTALMAIGVIGSIWNRYRLYAPYTTAEILLGQTLSYLPVSIVLVCYIVAIHSYIFGYPQNGTIGAIIAIMVPYIIGFTLLGVAISTRFRRSESAILTLVATSVPALLVSGASIPKQGFSKLLYSIGKLLPSSSAVESYYRVEAMGATAGEVLPQIATLWLLVIVYGTVAYIAIKIKASERTINPRTPL